MTAAYNPWSHVAALPDVLVVVEDLQHADAYWEPDERVILLDRRLSQAQRRCRLAHELAHIEAGDVCCSHGPDRERLGRRQEERAERAAAAWLIEIDDLAEALRWSLGYDEVAEYLHVEQRTVRARILGLTPGERAYIERRLASKEDVA